MDQDWRKHFSFLQQGAIIQKFKIGEHNIVLGFDDPAHYSTEYSPFVGETIGRCANRISNACIEKLNGKSYELFANNGSNTLHGGERGWGKRRFEGPVDVTRNGKDAVEFTYRSIDMEEGFPGTVQLRVWYTGLVKETDGKQQVSLEIEYEAALADEEVEQTIINVCNHSYFNITNNPTIEGTLVTLSTTMHQITNEDDIPTGVIGPFPGIASNEAFTLGSSEPAIDHCFILNDRPESVAIETRQQPLQKLCEMQHLGSKIKLEVHSTEPAFQFYTGQYIDVPALDGAPAIGPRSGICVEASRYVNAINNDAWRSMVILNKGQLYGSRTVYTATQL